MKILFIVPYPKEGPSNRFRVEQYFPLLTRKGIKYKIRSFCNTGLYAVLYKRGYYIKKVAYLMLSVIKRAIDIFNCVNYDIVFIHREAFPTKGYTYEALLRWLGEKVIYDFDDAVFLTKPAKVNSIIESADHVIAGNRFLQEYALKYNKKVGVLNTPIDTNRYAPRPVRKESGKVVIGWIGTSSTSIYLHSLRNVFRFLNEKYKNIELRIVGGNSDMSWGPFLINKDWTLESEVRELQAFDIGIMPMPDTDWTRGKCAFKIIEYMAVGIPLVASPVGMNLEVIQDGINGFLASSDKNWIDKLSLLIENAVLRESLGRNGRKTVEDRYSLRGAEPKFIAILEEVARER